MRVLVSAYACETGRGGEGEIGWRLVHWLAQEHDVCVITRANLRPVHEAAFAKEPKPEGLRFIYFDLPWILRFYKRGKRFFLVYYYLWQIGVGLRARRLTQAQEFDVLHHLTGGMDWMPAGLALVPGRFVWGPVGSENTHPAIRRHLPLKSRLEDRARIFVRWAMRNLDPFTRVTGARAEVVLSHTPETLPRRYAPRLKAFVQTGITDIPALARPKQHYGRGTPFRLVYAGGLKRWKGGRLALDASLEFFETHPEATLTVLGDGRLRTEMEAVARAHPEGARVTFRGRVLMEQLVDELHSADLFVYPTFHHGLATVVLQAMLTGLPTVCVEGDATGRAIGQEAGITVPLSHGHDPSRDLARAIASLSADEPRRAALAMAARRIALKRYSYVILGNRLIAAYRELLSDKCER